MSGQETSLRIFKDDTDFEDDPDEPLPAVTDHKNNVRTALSIGYKFPGDGLVIKNQPSIIIKEITVQNPGDPDSWARAVLDAQSSRELYIGEQMERMHAIMSQAVNYLAPGTPEFDDFVRFLHDNVPGFLEEPEPGKEPLLDIHHKPLYGDPLPEIESLFNKSVALQWQDFDTPPENPFHLYLYRSIKFTTPQDVQSTASLSRQAVKEKTPLSVLSILSEEEKRKIASGDDSIGNDGILYTSISKETALNRLGTAPGVVIRFEIPKQTFYGMAVNHNAYLGDPTQEEIRFVMGLDPRYVDEITEYDAERKVVTTLKNTPTSASEKIEFEDDKDEDDPVKNFTF